VVVGRVAGCGAITSPAVVETVQVDQLDGRVAVRDAAQVAGDEVAPVRSHDGVVDSDERFGDPVGGAVAAECVGFVADQADVLEYVERMGEIRRLAAQVVGDAAAGRVAGGDGGQDGVVERGVVEFGFLREEVPGLAEQRRPGLRTARTTPSSKSSGPEEESPWVNSRRYAGVPPTTTCVRAVMSQNCAASR
jgi:hypothetical protein